MIINLCLWMLHLPFTFHSKFDLFRSSVWLQRGLLRTRHCLKILNCHSLFKAFLCFIQEVLSIDKPSFSSLSTYPLIPLFLCLHILRKVFSLLLWSQLTIFFLFPSVSSSLFSIHYTTCIHFSKLLKVVLWWELYHYVPPLPWHHLTHAG